MPNDPTHIGSDIDFIVKNANNKPAYSDKDGKPVKKVLTDTPDYSKLQEEYKKRAQEDFLRRVGKGVSEPEKYAKGGRVKGVGVAQRGFGKGKLT